MVEVKRAALGIERARILLLCQRFANAVQLIKALSGGSDGAQSLPNLAQP